MSEYLFQWKAQQAVLHSHGLLDAGGMLCCATVCYICKLWSLFSYSKNAEWLEYSSTLDWELLMICHSSIKWRKVWFGADMKQSLAAPLSIRFLSGSKAKTRATAYFVVIPLFLYFDILQKFRHISACAVLALQKPFLKSFVLSFHLNLYF